MKEGFFYFLRGSYLTNQDAYKNWRFMIFLCFLATLMILSGHKADDKLLEISQKKEEVRQLRSRFVASRKSLQDYKLESRLRATLAQNEIYPSNVPPKKIIINEE